MIFVTRRDTVQCVFLQVVQSFFLSYNYEKGYLYIYLEQPTSHTPDTQI